MFTERNKNTTMTNSTPQETEINETTTLNPNDLTRAHIVGAFNKYDQFGKPKGAVMPKHLYVRSGEGKEYPAKIIFIMALDNNDYSNKIRSRVAVACFKRLGFEVYEKKKPTD